MSRVDMCRMLRFAPVGHIYFTTGTPEALAFEARFKELGGMDPAISKQINAEHDLELDS